MNAISVIERPQGRSLTAVDVRDAIAAAFGKSVLEGLEEYLAAKAVDEAEYQ